MPRFASHQSFLDPPFTNDGQPYAPIRFRELVKECYLISKNMHTTYMDVLKMSSTERKYLIQFLVEEARQMNEMIQRRKAEAEANR